MTFTQTKNGWSCLPESKGGFKSPASWLLEALGARWTHRRGYTLSERAKTDFCAFQEAGITARWRIAAKDRDPRLFQIPGREGYVTRAEARKWVEGRAEPERLRG